MGCLPKPSPQSTSEHTNTHTHSNTHIQTAHSIKAASHTTPIRFGMSSQPSVRHLSWSLSLCPAGPERLHPSGHGRGLCLLLLSHHPGLPRLPPGEQGGSDPPTHIHTHTHRHCDIHGLQAPVDNFGRLIQEWLREMCFLIKG